MSLLIKVLDTVEIKDRPGITFGVRMIQKLPGIKGLHVWGQFAGGTQIIKYTRLKRIKKGPKHKQKRKRE